MYYVFYMEDKNKTKNGNENSGNTVKKGPCCVCKETKSVRDQCLMFNSEELCVKEMEAHKKCLIDNGFTIL